MTETSVPAASTASLRRLCAASAVPEGEGLVVDAGDRAIAVWNVDGHYYATDETCSHGHASLVHEGMLEGFEIVCGLHQGSFDVRTGQAVSAPCVLPIRSYKLLLVEGDLCLQLDSAAP